MFWQNGGFVIRALTGEYFNCVWCVGGVGLFLNMFGGVSVIGTVVLKSAGRFSKLVIASCSLLFVFLFF